MMIYEIFFICYLSYYLTQSSWQEYSTFRFSCKKFAFFNRIFLSRKWSNFKRIKRMDVALPSHCLSCFLWCFWKFQLTESQFICLKLLFVRLNWKLITRRYHVFEIMRNKNVFPMQLNSNNSGQNCHVSTLSGSLCS